jgi:hypothetical protein
LSTKDGIALTAERYSQQNATKAGVDLSRPSRTA